MNEDEMQALEPRAGDELERALARYARVRLEPTPAATRRARSALLEQVWRRRLSGTLGPTMDERDVAGSMTAAVALASAGPSAPARRRLFATWSGRRLGASLAAAVIAGLLVGGTSFAASRAGGPLYTTRVAIEELGLPGDPGARVDAVLALAQSRLAEVVEAAGRKDVGALDAALGAYEHEIEALPDGRGGPADRALVAVTFHREVLEQLLASAPAPAVDELTIALERSSGVISALRAHGAAGPGAPANGGPNPNAGGGNPSTGGDQGAGGGNPSAGDGNQDGGGGTTNEGGSAGGDHPERTPRPTRPPAPEAPTSGALASPPSDAGDGTEGGQGQGADH